MMHINEPQSEATAVNPRTDSFPQVLILLAAYFFGVSGGATSISEQVKDAVKDDGQRKIAVAIAEGVEAELKQMNAQYVVIRDSFFAAASNHDGSSDELRLVLERGVQAAETAQATIVDARFRLVETMEDDDWNRLCKSLAGD